MEARNGIEIKKMGNVFVVDPKGITTMCEISHVSKIKDDVVVSKTAKITPISPEGTTESK